LVATAFAGPEGAETDGFMLLEFCPGTLLELLQHAPVKLLDELTVYSVFSEICKAVSHMHSQVPPLAHR
jgi:AP2-associated kinase